MDWKNILSYAVKKVDKSIKLTDFPHITKNGKWVTTGDGYWTGGFWAGLLWFSYKITSNERYKAEAYKWAKRLESRKDDKTFDLSFLFYPSFVIGYEITKDNYLKSVALEAAETLSTLFHEKAGFVYSKIDEKTGRTIIDAMLDLQLLWWAYDVTGDEKYFRPAYEHCSNTIKELIREDYSTIHVIDFDLETGKILGKITGQGYSDESCWSRGPAWAIYGFTLAYKYTRNKLFLKTAEKLAEYFIDNLPEDFVSCWDFNDPNKEIRDTSAATIASSGLLTLSEFGGMEDFKEAAIKILNSLCSNYLTKEDEDGILKHGCFHKPAGIGVNESLIWGNYYFVEAIMKIKSANNFRLAKAP